MSIAVFFNFMIRSLREEKCRKFVEEGQPGHKLQADYDNIVNCLSFPQEIMDGELGDILRMVEPPVTSPEESHHEDDDEKHKKPKKMTPEQKFIREIYADGMYYLTPTFIKTILYLRKLNRNFSIVFRTFGTDTDNLI